MGTLLGGRPNKNITYPEIVDTVGTALRTPTEERQERKGGKEGVLQAPNHSDGSILITTSDPIEDRASATLTTVDISEQDDAVAGTSGGAAIAPDIDSEANDGDPEDHQYM